jgi:hypothetical protein
MSPGLTAADCEHRPGIRGEQAERDSEDITRPLRFEEALSHKTTYSLGSTQRSFSSIHLIFRRRNVIQRASTLHCTEASTTTPASESPIDHPPHM